MSLPPVYVGNYEYDADERELERTVEKFGPVKNMEFKSGFCFVHYEDKRDAEDCIRALDGKEWGRQSRRLRVEFAKNDANVRARESARRAAADPNTTLFVAGFDPRSTRTRDLEKAFDEFGRLKRCEIKKTFAFVEFENIEDAKEACNGMHGKKVNGREVTVEYVVKQSGGGASGGAGRGRSPGRDDRGRYGRDRDGRIDDRDRGRDRRYGDADRGGDRGGRRRSRSRSHERRRRSPSKSRSRSPQKRRGRSVTPRRSPPRARRSRSPVRSPPRGGNGGKDRSRSPARN